MKILFVTHRYSPHTGGVETHVQEIATRLANRGHKVSVFSADAGSNVPNQTIDEGVRVRRFRSVSVGDAFYVAPQIALAVRRADADIVHAHNFHAFPLFFAALGVTDKNLFLTTHYHGGSANRVRDVLLTLYRPLGRWAVRQADDVIAVSKWERERLRAELGVDATIIPNGLNVDRFANANPEHRDCPYLLSVGRLEKYKGVQYAIGALSQLPDYELVIAGCGPYRSELERIAETEDVTDRVTFLGYVAEERLPSLYAGADAYLSLSTFESYGMTVAEALTAGTPCVVAASGALADWTNKNGCVGVNDRSPQSILNAVRDVLNCEFKTDVIPDWDDVVDRLFDRYNVLSGCVDR